MAKHVGVLRVKNTRAEAIGPPPPLDNGHRERSSRSYPGPAPTGGISKREADYLKKLWAKT